MSNRQGTRSTFRPMHMMGGALVFGMLTIFLAVSGIRVRAGTSTATVTVVVAAPYVTGILPYNLPQATPTNITITGNGFENSSGITVLSVTFTGTHQYTVTSGCKALSPTEITCTTPPMDSGSYTIIVNFSNGQNSTPAFAGSNTIVVYLLATPTPSLTPTATATPTATVTPSPALSPTVSPSPSTSPSPSFTASPSPSSSPSKPNPPTSSGGFFGSITHAVSSAGHAIGSGVKSITTFVSRHVVVVSSSMIIIIIVLIIVLLLSKRKKKEDDEPKSRIRL